MKRLTKIGLTLMLTLFVAISGSAQKKQTKKTTQTSDLQKEIQATNAKVDNLKKEIDAASKELQKNSQKKKKTLTISG